MTCKVTLFLIMVMLLLFFIQRIMLFVYVCSLIFIMLHLMIMLLFIIWSGTNYFLNVLEIDTRDIYLKWCNLMTQQILIIDSVYLNIQLLSFLTRQKHKKCKYVLLKRHYLHTYITKL